MTRVVVDRCWPDGEQLHISVTAPDDHPDGLLSEAKRVAIEALVEASAVVVAEALQGVADDDEAETNGG